MRARRSFVRWDARTFFAVTAFLLVSCSSGSNPSAPGGGGTGSTAPAPFSLTFPRSGHSAQLLFPNAGTFGYHCQKHRANGMNGVVTVESGGLDSAVVSVGAGGLMYSPAAVQIRPGGTVRWVNASTRTDHTVTSN